MHRYTDTVANRLTGQPAINAQVLVLNTDGSQASVYSDNGVTPITQPVLTDATGTYFFYVADGVYNLQITGNGVPQTIPAVEIFDIANTAALAKQAATAPAGVAPPVIDPTGAAVGQVLALGANGTFQAVNPGGVAIQNALGPSTIVAPSQAAVQAALTAILTGKAAFTGLPDEAVPNSVIPAAGSGLPYLSGGVLKIA